MPVIPQHTTLFQSQKHLYQFLASCQQTCVDKMHSQIVSISLEIDPVDPLAVLHELASPDQFHFYFERGLEGEAIAAIDSIMSFKTEGSQRFSKAQKFIHSCFENLISTGASERISSTPRFFCSFTFFDQVSTADSPFSAATVFLPRWQVVRQKDRCIATANLIVNDELKLEPLVETIWEKFQTIRLAKYGLFNIPDSIRRRLNQWKIVDTNRFHSGVVSVLHSIDTHHLDKVVLAHIIDVFSQFPFEWIQSLHNLRKVHPDCCVFSTGSGKGQSFIGASPERLIRISNRKLMTDALAGSAPRGKTMSEDADLARRLLNSEKERHEHQVVVNFIVQCLSELGLTPRLAIAPHILQLSNIQHLHTPIQAVLPPSVHPLEILAKLHPTPAVAGVPREIACEQIRRYEAFERSLYAAPLGWIDAEGNAEFIVGIRSALIEGCHARLYAGAGIVTGSDPDKELAEVKLKLQALLQALV